MTIDIETTCLTCGCVFTPSPQDIRRGVWRLCPPCRDGPDDEGTGSHRTPPQRRRDDPAASTFPIQESTR